MIRSWSNAMLRIFLGILLGSVILLPPCIWAASSATLQIPASRPRLWFADPIRQQDARSAFIAAPFSRPNYSAFDPAATNYARALRAVVGNDPQACLLALNGDPASPPPPANRPDLPLDEGILGMTFRGVEAPSTFRDQMRQQGEAWILVYDWCRPQMTAEQVATLVERWNGYMQRELADTFSQQGEEASNYWAGRVRNLLMWGIASYDDNPQAQSFIDAALETRMGQWFPAWHQAFGRGGIFPEGSAYGIVNLSYPLVGFTTASGFGHDAFALTPYYREAVYAIIYGTTPGPTLNSPGGQRYELFPFGDDEVFSAGGSVAGRTYLADFMKVMASRSPAAGHAAHARAWRSLTNAPTSWLFSSLRTDGSDSDTLDTLPLDYYAPGAGVLAARTAHDADATQVHLQLGTPGGMSHRHLDAGSFQIWRKGRWVTRESVGYSDRIVALGESTGSRNTVDTVSPVAHNTLLFEGRSTAMWIGDGPRPITQPVNPERDQPRQLPLVKRLQHAPQFSYVAVDYSGAYRNGLNTRVDWPYAGRVWREFLFIRPLQTLLVFDRAESTSDSLNAYYGTANWHWAGVGRRVAAEGVRRHFIMHFENQPTAAANQVTAPLGSQTAQLVTLLPRTPIYRLLNEDYSGPPDDSHAGQHRVEIEQSGTAEAYFLNLVTAYDQAEPPLQASLQEDSENYIVSATHATRGSVVVTLRKGMNSEGGSISINGGTPVPLRETVQAISVGDNGPVWHESLILQDGFEGMR